VPLCIARDVRRSGSGWTPDKKLGDRGRKGRKGKKRKKTHITTKRRVEDDVVAREERVDVTPAPAIKRHDRQPPVTRHRLPGLDVRRDGVAREEPHVDPTALPLHHIHAATAGIEARAIARRIAITSTAARIAAVLAAVPAHGDGARQRPGVVDHAPGARVHRDRVRGLRVHALQDVDLAAVRPVGAVGPERGPHAADAAGHVRDVGDEEAMRVCFVAGDADGGAAAGWVGRTGIDAHVDLVVGRAHHAGGLRGALRDVRDVAVGGVAAVEEAEEVEEVAGVVGVAERVRRGFGDVRGVPGARALHVERGRSAEGGEEAEEMGV
jgi:hypothetical protein